VDHVIPRLGCSFAIDFLLEGRKEYDISMTALQEVLQLLLRREAISKNQDIAALHNLLTLRSTNVRYMGASSSLIRSARYGISYLCLGLEPEFSWSTTCDELGRFLELEVEPGSREGFSEDCLLSFLWAEGDPSIREQ
jgi:hypothetical protein